MYLNLIQFYSYLFSKYLFFLRHIVNGWWSDYLSNNLIYIEKRVRYSMYSILYLFCILGCIFIFDIGISYSNDNSGYYLLERDEGGKAGKKRAEVASKRSSEKKKDDKKKDDKKVDDEKEKWINKEREKVDDILRDLYIKGSIIMGGIVESVDIANSTIKVAKERGSSGGKKGAKKDEREFYVRDNALIMNVSQVAEKNAVTLSVGDNLIIRGMYDEATNTIKAKSILIFKPKINVSNLALREPSLNEIKKILSETNKNGLWVIVNNIKNVSLNEGLHKNMPVEQVRVINSNTLFGKNINITDDEAEYYEVNFLNRVKAGDYVKVLFNIYKAEDLFDEDEDDGVNSKKKKTGNVFVSNRIIVYSDIENKYKYLNAIDNILKNKTNIKDIKESEREKERGDNRKEVIFNRGDWGLQKGGQGINPSGVNITPPHITSQSQSQRGMTAPIVKSEAELEKERLKIIEQNNEIIKKQLQQIKENEEKIKKMQEMLDKQIQYINKDLNKENRGGKSERENEEKVNIIKKREDFDEKRQDKTELVFDNKIENKKDKDNVKIDKKDIKIDGRTDNKNKIDRNFMRINIKEDIKENKKEDKKEDIKKDDSGKVGGRGNIESNNTEKNTEEKIKEEKIKEEKIKEEKLETKSNTKLDGDGSELKEHISKILSEMNDINKTKTVVNSNVNNNVNNTNVNISNTDDNDLLLKIREIITNIR